MTRSSSFRLSALTRSPSDFGVTVILPHAGRFVVGSRRVTAATRCDYIFECFFEFPASQTQTYSSTHPSSSAPCESQRSDTTRTFFTFPRLSHLRHRRLASSHALRTYSTHKSPANRTEPGHRRVSGSGSAPLPAAPWRGIFHRADRRAGRAVPGAADRVARDSMTNINDVLDGHVGLDIECVGPAVPLNAYVPNLQVPNQVK